MNSCNNNITLPIGPRGPQGPQGPAGATGAPGADGINGIGITWLGTFADPGPLTEPSLNDAYYNSTDGVSYIWDGDSWEILAQDGAQGIQGIQGIQGPPGVGAAPNVQEEGVTVNTAALTVINFTGAGATATETSPGVVEVNIPGGGGGAVTHIDGLDATTADPIGLSEQVNGIPEGTSIGVDDTPTADMFIKGASAVTNGYSYASNFPASETDTTILLNVTNTSGAAKKYLMIVNFTVEYNTGGANPELGNLRIYSALSNAGTVSYKAGSAQYVGPKTALFTDLVIPVSFVDVVEVPDTQKGLVCIDLPGVLQSETDAIATLTGGGARIVGLNTNIIQLN